MNTDLTKLPKSRGEASKLGEKYYFTGRPCPKGHLSKRNTKAGTCYECALESNRKNYHKDIEASRERHRQRRKDDPAPSREAVRRWSAKNPGYYRRKSLEWRKNNPGKQQELSRRWRRRNLERSRAIGNAAGSLRRLRIRGQPPLTKSERKKILEIYREARLLTIRTRVQHHVDHIKPLSKGGHHHPDNLQILTATDNLKKGAKLT